MIDYLPEDCDEDCTAQGEDDEDGGDKSVGDHGEGDLDEEEEGYVERVEPEGSEYVKGDD